MECQPHSMVLTKMTILFFGSIKGTMPSGRRQLRVLWGRVEMIVTIMSKSRSAHQRRKRSCPVIVKCVQGAVMGEDFVWRQKVACTVDVDGAAANSARCWT